MGEREREREREREGYIYIYIYWSIYILHSRFSAAIVNGKLENAMPPLDNTAPVVL